jgi:hypothetical protein
MKFNFREIMPGKFWRKNASPSGNSKIHKSFASQSGEEFVIESVKGHLDLYVMTSQRPGLKTNDYILIQGQSEKELYKILEIDDYCSGLPDMWIAKLSSANLNEQSLDSKDLT